MNLEQVGFAVVAGVLGTVCAQVGYSHEHKSGEHIYREVCSECHATGVSNAPKFGDREVWQPLIAEGQAVLTAHGWVGVRAMPPKGGRAELSLEEFSRATAFMVRTAGGNWKDPDAKTLDSIRKEEAKRVAELNRKKS